VSSPSRGYTHGVNPWHDVELGEHIEQHFRCVIEIPKGSKVKYELDKKTGLLWLDRVLHSAVHYPANYGLLPHYHDVAALPPHRLEEIRRFFLDYKVLEHKTVDVEHIQGRAEAEQVIRDAVRLYRDRIAPTLPGAPRSSG